MKNGTHILTLPNGYHLWSHTENAGQSDKMIAVHGGPGDTHESFESFPAEIPGAEITCYDQLGSWYSDQPDFSDPKVAERTLKIDYFVDELEQVRRQLGYEQFTLLGYSWGGMIALEYALKHPEHLTKLIIVGMADRDADFTDRMKEEVDKVLTKDEAEYVFLEAKKGEFDDALFNQFMGKFYRDYYTRFSQSQTKHAVDTTNYQLADLMMGRNPFQTSGVMAGWTVEKRVSEIHTPTLILIGDQDMIPVKRAQAMVKQLPHGKLAIIPDATHVSIRDNPEFFFEQVNNFLTESDTNIQN
ncbi:proline iminopeptidase-family hydrolase [Oenococcus kitaharae]|uniref:Proline iminopeptidase n=1 Tax=Oenococcus kitaharae DSM 17330 TaxID=1045004 RepID=G9WF74_9LACO|nr:proline iminopeptidase-family hydrolase [Oenococcus kitaharae]EHN58794.1 Proline iminopeptidase [Oenococcus kitaharae DSM 17330]OEY81863.1 alpha/beta hydrolase [Oenococcus kitaharae]OEY84092.1 alpha/beta hydrolase [Oenococcus kitaharae]OEY85548.1 alpha/beta hydrolase [Oenococcus kitaharae]